MAPTESKKRSFTIVFVPADVQEPVEDWQISYAKEDEVECLFKRLKVNLLLIIDSTTICKAVFQLSGGCCSPTLPKASQAGRQSSCKPTETSCSRMYLRTSAEP